MATLTIRHTDDLDVVHEITRLATANGATHLDATEAGTTTATFTDEAQARTVMAALTQAGTVTSLTVEP